jgi:DNA-binding NtrC family response regulator
VAAVSLGLALAPIGVLGARPGRRISVLALMGVSLAVALASARTVSPYLGRTHDLAWLVAALATLDLVLPRRTPSFSRALALGGFALAALLAWALSSAGLLPEAAFGVVVVVGLFCIGALHQVLLVGRGHALEGALAGVAFVSLALGLAYSWFGPFSGLLATTTESMVALLLWLGHLAWVDPRWRTLRRAGAPFLIASAACFLVALALAPESRLEPWKLGMFALGSSVLWWAAFTFARKVLQRAVWTTSGRIAAAAATARDELMGRSSLDDIAAAILSPFVTLPLDPDSGLPELVTFEPPLRARIEAGERPSIRSGDAPAAITHALMQRESKWGLDLLALRPRIVREPQLRELVELMQNRSIGLVLPCVHLEHLEGLLILPLEDRAEPLSYVELEELGRLGDALGGALSSALAQRRAESHIHELSELRRNAEERIELLQGEVEQLRDQCDVLGRGLAEDQTLHVAYSPSMRRVQTRAIELAPSEDPILLIAGAGSPVLPVSRFIHDRGPRWDAPFVVADCAASSPDDVLGLLFGAEGGRRGWFDSATGGTLLLRDLPALPRDAQAELASALRRADEAETQGEGELPDASVPTSAPPRIIATSRADLAALRQEEALDPELQRCFGRVGLRIPPLRERREDVPSLVLLAIDRACRVLARDPVGIDQAAMEALVDHEWPGDVAELELIVELAAGRARGKTIARSDLPPLAWPADDSNETLEGTYVEVERRLLERALRRAGGNKSQAARRLGLKRTTFLDKLRRHGLDERPADELGDSAVG